MATIEQQLEREIAILEAKIENAQKALDMAKRQLAEWRALRSANKPISVNAVTPQEHGMATSKGLARDPLVKAANAAGYTLTSLARRLQVSAATLSKARKGQRSIRGTVAAQIAADTGFEATAANWPGGIT